MSFKKLSCEIKPNQIISGFICHCQKNTQSFSTLKNFVCSIIICLININIERIFIHLCDSFNKLFLFHITNNIIYFISNSFSIFFWFILCLFYLLITNDHVPNLFSFQGFIKWPNQTKSQWMFYSISNKWLMKKNLFGSGPWLEDFGGRGGGWL